MKSRRSIALAGFLAVGASLSALGVAASAQANTAPLDLAAPIADYKIYVSDLAAKLVKDTQSFVAAVKAGDLKKAQALFGPTRIHFERIEPIAELFEDLDKSIDSRADDHDGKESDEGFTGFHRLEYELFEKKTTEGLGDLADKLMADVAELQKRIADSTFPPEKVVGGAASLMEEVAKTKISGEEDRYSHTDLWDFEGNLDGSKKIFELFRPLIEKDKAFVQKVEANFAAVGRRLAKYKTPAGYEPYDKLSEADRKALAGSVNTLAEDLSTLRGKLGLN